LEAVFGIKEAMDKNFTPAQVEEKIYDFWEKNGLFESHVNKGKKPFCIILPPPNANANLHLGHAMYVYEDVMIRYHRLLGDEVLWLPGADHAGFETQYVFEKNLQKDGKSRFDYDRETLFKMIWKFVMSNKGNMEKQLRRLGFALDWKKQRFTMDKAVVKIVHETFKKLYEKDLVYRAVRLVNYCTFCGTAFSDLEVVHKEKVSPLYYMKYGPFVLATTRPETKFGDTGLAVNPKDKRYQKWIGKEIEAEGLLGKFRIKVVGDDSVDPKFGTGVVKVTPAHDFTDFETGKRHNLPLKQVIGYDGKLNHLTGPYQGLYVNQARKKIVEDLKAKGLLDKIDEGYQNRVGTCYKCSRTIEPLPLEQWYVKVKPLADKAKEAVEKGDIKIYPKRFKKILLWWLDNFRDWNISRQVVWGIRIPAYYCRSKAKSQKSKEWFVSVDRPEKCQICGGQDFEQDADTFDTWFSSGQWPFATLQTNSKELFDYFYPTSVMETGYDILPWWVARMIMLGIFSTGKVPFKNVFLHGIVRDKNGKKMSKSKGNVINPIEMIDKYGADAFRASLMFGVKEGADLSLSDERVVGMRNFANKIWNIGRFLEISQKSKFKSQNNKPKVKIINDLGKEFELEQKKYKKYMDSYQFSKALGSVYEFLWHRYADYYLEQLKEEVLNGKIEVLDSLKKVYFENLRLLHPFMPFLTETIWQVFHGKDSSILAV
jgi:valyl-tRNA synthetase